MGSEDQDCSADRQLHRPLGLALVLAVRSDWSRGLGPALILLGAIGFLIDGLASRRAAPCTAALEELSVRHPGP